MNRRTSSNEAIAPRPRPEEIGDYFAWGETVPKEEYSLSNYKWCMGSRSAYTKNTSFPPNSAYYARFQNANFYIYSAATRTDGYVIRPVTQK